MGMIREFKEFAMRGNVVDMAIGIILGGAFGKIVTSLVNDVIMPPIGLLLGNAPFSDLVWKIHEGATPAQDVTIKYGQFVNTVLDFVLVAWCVFLVIKMMNRMQQTLEQRLARTPPEATSKECPKCCSSIPVKATRCPHCTSEV